MDNVPEKLQQYSDEFDKLCQERHDMGEEKYGPGKFLGVDTLTEAIQEIVDLSNYARYTFIRIRLFQDALTEDAPETLNNDFSQEIQ